MSPVLWQRIEGGLIAITAIAGIVVLAPGWPWWIWPFVALAPDLSMLGYLAGSRIGARVYNIVHLYAVGALLMLAGAAAGLTWPLVLGLVWVAHVGIDRALGYGLKEERGFHATHLGRIGRGM